MDRLCVQSTKSPATKTAFRNKDVCETTTTTATAASTADQRVHTSPVVAMLAAMCVRKTGDTSTHLSLSQSGCSTTSKDSFTSSRKKHKGFKIAVGKRSSNKEKEAPSIKDDEKIPIQKVRDDEDGHLIYQKGDYLDSRCKLSSKVQFTSWFAD